MSACRDAPRSSRPRERLASAASDGRQLLDVRLDDQDRGVRVAHGQLLGDLERRRLSQVVDVRLEGQAEGGDDRVTEPVGPVRDLGEDDLGLVVVDLAGRADEPGLLGHGADDEPRVDGDAVAADARSGLEDVDARVLVRQLDELEDVDAEPVGDHRQLVGEGDVDVAERVLGELGHLGGRRVGQVQLGVAEHLRRGPSALGGLPRQATDDAVVRDELDHDPPGQHALGAVGEVDDRAPVASRRARGRVGRRGRARPGARSRREVTSTRG